MTEFDPNRRNVLMAGGAALTVAMAGCLGGDDDDDNGNGDGADIADDPEGAVQEWMDGEGAEGWDGNIEDLTGEDEVTIGNGDNAPDYQYGPPAARIDVGTTVTFEWTSDGHTLHEEDSSTDFDELTDIEDEGFEHEMTLDEEGAALYYCQPHRGQGHVGALIVE